MSKKEEQEPPQFVDCGNYLTVTAKEKTYFFSKCHKVLFVNRDGRDVCGICEKPLIKHNAQEYRPEVKSPGKPVESHSNRRWDELGKDGYVREE